MTKIAFNYFKDVEKISKLLDMTKTNRQNLL